MLGNANCLGIKEEYQLYKYSRHLKFTVFFKENSCKEHLNMLLCVEADSTKKPCTVISFLLTRNLAARRF